MRTFLSDTEQHEFVSNVRGRSFVLSVVLPEGYLSSNKSYPVVYVLDGDALLGMVASLTVPAMWAGEAPELIVVSVGYGADGYDEWASLRDLDLGFPGSMIHDLADPARVPQPDVFLRMLTEDVVPFIDRRYRTIPDDRCLYGYSWGGFFVLYALLRGTRAFNRYVSGGAFTYSTMGYLCNEAQRILTTDTELSARVFVAMSEHEAKSCVAAMHEWVDAFGGVSSSSLRVVGEVYPGESHGSAAIALTYLHGLREVFDR